MAATATQIATYQFHGGSQGLRKELYSIAFDADATVELYTGLTKVLGINFGCVGNAGNANTLSIDETFTAGGVAVPSNGQLTIDAAATSVANWFVDLTGF